MPISQSYISLYQQCPYKFWKKYCCGESEESTKAMDDGTTLHKLRTIKNLDLVENLYDPEIVKADKAIRENEEIKELTIIGNEMKIKQKVDGYNFFGIIDCIAKTKDGEDLIIDWKYQKTNWSDENAKKYAIQKALYKKMTGISNFWFVIVTKHKTPRIEIIKDSEEMKWEEVLDLIKKEENDFGYEPKQNDGCWFCKWKESICPIWF